MINVFVGKYEFLSNFYPSEIVIEEIKYPTVEHAFQAAKTLDMEERKRIAFLPTPGKAKRAGRSVLLREDWEEAKDAVMYGCIKKKFLDPILSQKLLETGEEYLEEGTTWHDNYWGNCSCDKCRNIPGKNMLGKTLMRVREELREEKKVKKLLVVVDMQNDFIDGTLGTKEAQSIVPNVIKKISEWDGDIFCTLDTHTENYLNTREGRMLPIPHCIKGTEGHGINKDVLAALIDKSCKRFSALNTLCKHTFGSTALPEIIKGTDVEYIEIIGLCTDICVVSNAMLLKANYPELDIAVDASCCAGVTPESHKAALLTMKMCQINIIGE